MKAQSAFPKEDLAPTVTAQFQEAPEMHVVGIHMQVKDTI